MISPYKYSDPDFNFEEYLLKKNAEIINHKTDFADRIYKLSKTEELTEHFYFEIYDGEFVRIYVKKYPDKNFIYDGMKPTNFQFAEQLIVHLFGATS